MATQRLEAMISMKEILSEISWDEETTTNATKDSMLYIQGG